ncbi:hypothetical protein GQ53DRAFT_170375 [Thozetella sp. PMI_491]|nr:hypothetical protein GQ53DRAFT_170375 [Thozetella sp. PMI_491]
MDTIKSCHNMLPRAPGNIEQWSKAQFADTAGQELAEQELSALLATSEPLPADAAKHGKLDRFQKGDTTELWERRVLHRITKPVAGPGSLRSRCFLRPELLTQDKKMCGQGYCSSLSGDLSSSHFPSQDCLWLGQPITPLLPSRTWRFSISTTPNPPHAVQRPTYQLRCYQLPMYDASHNFLCQSLGHCFHVRPPGLSSLPEGPR